MQIVIKIDEELYQSLRYMKQYNPRFLSGYEKTILDGTPLPKNHGDLIDRQQLKETMEKDMRKAMSFVDLTDFVWLAPTIIEADKGE